MVIRAIGMTIQTVGRGPVNWERWPEPFSPAPPVGLTCGSAGGKGEGRTAASPYRPSLPAAQKCPKVGGMVVRASRM